MNGLTSGTPASRLRRPQRVAEGVAGRGDDARGLGVRDQRGGERDEDDAHEHVHEAACLHQTAPGTTGATGVWKPTPAPPTAARCSGAVAATDTSLMTQSTVPAPPPPAGVEIS